MTTKTCTRRTLAAGELAMIEQCSCGAIHLTIGAVTLRLAPGAIGALASTMNDAARALVLGKALDLGEARSEILS